MGTASPGSASHVRRETPTWCHSPASLCNRTLSSSPNAAARSQSRHEVVATHRWRALREGQGQGHRANHLSQEPPSFASALTVPFRNQAAKQSRQTASRGCSSGLCGLAQAIALAAHRRLFCGKSWLLCVRLQQRRVAMATVVCRLLQELSRHLFVEELLKQTRHPSGPLILPNPANHFVPVLSNRSLQSHAGKSGNGSPRAAANVKIHGCATSAGQQQASRDIGV